MQVVKTGGKGHFHLKHDGALRSICGLHPNGYWSRPQAVTVPTGRITTEWCLTCVVAHRSDVAA